MARPQTAAGKQTSAPPPAAPPAAATKPKGNVGGKAKAAGKVTVACKIPTGLELQHCTPTKWIEETPSGSRERLRYDRVGPTVFVRGTAYPVGTIPKGYPSRPIMVGGYALTPNVDADFFDEWIRQNKDTDMVRNRMIFAYARRDDVVGEARENKDRQSGLEPLNPENDPRMPRPINAMITPIETADENVSQFQIPDGDDDLVD